jgi:glutathione peroxidase
LGSEAQDPLTPYCDNSYRVVLLNPMSLKQSLFGGLTREPSNSNPTIYPLYVNTRAGEPIDLSAYRGRVVLIVNTASKCGFTKQYDALEALHQRYNKQGLVVLGFPSNDFMGQEPGSDAEIESFCRVNHGVTFEIFPKASVTGDAVQPVFDALTTRGPRDLRGRVRWNFEKFLLDRDGRLVGRWRSWVNPGWKVFERSLIKTIRP